MLAFENGSREGGGRGSVELRAALIVDGGQIWYRKIDEIEEYLNRYTRRFGQVPVEKMLLQEGRRLGKHRRVDLEIAFPFSSSLLPSSSPSTTSNDDFSTFPILHHFINPTFTTLSHIPFRTFLSSDRFDFNPSPPHPSRAHSS